tara:strand:- start:239 stop:772 length:534 start_codon:yes stop_codon:yes gene_type:complete
MSHIEISDKDKIRLNDLGSYSYHCLDNGKPFTSALDIAIVFSNYNLSINESLMNGYLNRLTQKKFSGCIGSMKAPGGAFELPILCQRIIKSYSPSVILALGCITKGDTKHYDFLSSTVTASICNLSLTHDTPIINGILTVETESQAIDRAGTKENKGQEFADTTLDLLNALGYLSGQ